MTTTRGPLSAVPDALGGLDRAAVSEAARSATLAQNRAGATRLEAACALVEHFRRDAEAREGSLADSDSDSDSDSGAGARRSRRGYARLDPQARARDHLVAACQLTCWHAARLVTAGVQVHTRLPRLRAVVGRGEVPEALAVDLACRLAEVPDAIVGDVEDEVTARIAEDLSGGDRPGRGAVESMIADAVARCDPDAARAATEAAVRARAVRFRRARAGMTTLWAVLPAEDAELLRLRIETDAATAAADGRRGGIDQLRADALVALAVYAATGAGAGASGGGEVVEGIELGEVRAGADLPRPGLANAAAAGQPIRISVIAAAAQGLANRVEFVHGTYSGYEWLCRELLAGEQARVRFEVLDPAPGAMDGPEHALRYVITPAMAERIRLRDGTCRHPGCAVRAEDCDIDHVIAFNRREPQLGGPTMEWNLVCLCRKHQREKTFGTNSYRTGPLGELIIATDTGHEHRTRPTGPLARARDAILERHLDAWADQLIGPDGYLRNPPGAARDHWRRNRPA